MRKSKIRDSVREGTRGKGTERDLRDVRDFYSVRAEVFGRVFFSLWSLGSLYVSSQPVPSQPVPFGFVYALGFAQIP